MAMLVLFILYHSFLRKIIDIGQERHSVNDINNTDHFYEVLIQTSCKSLQCPFVGFLSCNMKRHRNNVLQAHHVETRLKFSIRKHITKKEIFEQESVLAEYVHIDEYCK